MELNWKELGQKYGFDDSKINDALKKRYNSKYNIGNVFYINWLDEDEEKEIYWTHKKPDRWMIGEYSGRGKSRIKKMVKVKVIGNWCENSFDKEFVKKENEFVPLAEMDGGKIIIPMPVNVERYLVESVDEIEKATVNYKGMEYDSGYHAIGWVDGLYFKRVYEVDVE